MMPAALPPFVFNAAAAAFGTAAPDCVPLRGGTVSHVFRFRQAGSDFILRITPPGAEIDETTLRAGLAFSDFLARGGVSVPAPLRSQRGELIERIPAEAGDYLVAAFDRAPGVLAEELPFEVWDESRITILGQAVGRFHARARGYQPAPGLERPDWDESANCFHPSEEIGTEALRARRAEALAAVRGLPRDPSGFGWIHADIHGGNFMLEPAANRVTLLDFDDCVRGWYAMDIAMLLHDFCVLTPATDKDAFAARFLGAFLRGYFPAHPLNAVWIERLPLFLKLLETGIFAQVAGFADSVEPNSWVGRFMNGRRQRILEGRPVVELDFTQFRPPAP